MGINEDAILNQILTTIEHVETDIAEDRSAFDKFQHQLDAIVSRLDTLEGRRVRLENKVSDAVSGALEEAIEPLRDGIEEAIKANAVKTNKPFWTKLLKKLKRG